MRRQVRALIVAAALAGAGGAARAETRVEKPEYVVGIAGPSQTAAGAPSAFAVTVRVRGDFHLNHDYPSNFRVAAAGGLRYPREKVDRASGIVLEPCGAGAPPKDGAGSEATTPKSEWCSARLFVPFVAEAAGAHSVGGTLAFSVCDDERCLIEKVAVALPVAVK